MLAALTGNVGVPGGWASGLALQAPDGGPLWNVFPTGTNPVTASIPTFLWTEAVTRAKEFGPEMGLRGAARLDTPIKLIYAVASNALINQHANINRTAKILQDEALVQFIAVQDNFLTPTARFADIVLPACTQLETWGVEDGWKYGDEVFLMPKAVEPAGESKSDYAHLHGTRGSPWHQERVHGRPHRTGVGGLGARCVPKRTLPVASDAGGVRGKQHRPTRRPVEDADSGVRRLPGGSDEIAAPNALGKIEIFSAELHALGKHETIPPIPKYIQEWESPFDSAQKRLPLQVVGHHSLARVHSTMAGVDWLEEAFPQRVFVNPLDATARGLSNGDQVRVFNDRGELRIKCRITRRIMPGVVAIPQGAWWSPTAKGIDEGRVGERADVRTLDAAGRSAMPNTR